MIRWFALFILCLSSSQLPAQETWQYVLDAAVSADGTYYVVDRKLPGIWQLKDGKNSILYQGTSKYRTPMNAVRCITVAADGKIYAGDSATRDVYLVSPDGQVKPLANGLIGIPMSIAVAGDTLYVSDLETQRIWKIPTAGIPITQEPTEFAVIGGCRGLSIDDKGLIWAVSSLKPQLRRYTGDGKFEAIVDDLVFEFPHQVCVASDGTVYVTDGYAKAIWKLAPGGKPEKWISGEPFVNPIGIRPQGANLIICDSRANALFQVTPDKQVTKIFGGAPNPLTAAPPAASPPASDQKPAEPKPATTPPADTKPETPAKP